MRNLVLLVCFFSILSCTFRSDKEYLSKINDLPSVDILPIESAMILRSKDISIRKSLVIVYFRPDCPHSQNETRSLVSNMEKMKDVSFIFLTGATLSATRSYASDFHLVPNPSILTVGKDLGRVFARTLRIKGTPFIAIYDQHKKLLKIYHGEVPINNFLAVLNG